MNSSKRPDALRPAEASQVKLAAIEQQPVARLLTWQGPAHYTIPHGGVCARTFAEFSKEAADDPESYWKNGANLYTAASAASVPVGRVEAVEGKQLEVVPIDGAVWTEGMLVYAGAGSAPASDERKAFENWVKTVGDGVFAGQFMTLMWKAWQARAAYQPVPDMSPGWVRACDDEMVSAHLGVANLSDSYESAKAKLKTLIDWHVAVATDPAVNGGQQLVPVQTLAKWRDAFAEELSSWDIDPPLHHVLTSHDEISALLAAPKEAP